MVHLERLQVFNQAPYSQRFTDVIVRLFPNEIRQIQRRLKGGTLIDVGGGESRHMADFAFLAGAKQYINIDAIKQYNRVSNPKAKYVTGDASAYLENPETRRSIQGPCNFVINGLDGLDRPVAKELVAHMVSYLKEGDYIFGVYAPEIVADLLKRTELREVIHDPGTTFFAFAKHSEAP